MKNEFFYRVGYSFLFVAIFILSVVGVGQAQAEQDAARFKLTNTIKVGKNPHGIRFSDDGKKAFVALSGDGKIATIDLETMKVTKKVAVGRLYLRA